MEDAAAQEDCASSSTSCMVVVSYYLDSQSSIINLGFVRGLRMAQVMIYRACIRTLKRIRAYSKCVRACARIEDGTIVCAISATSATRANMREWNFHFPWCMEWKISISISFHGNGMESISIIQKCRLWSRNSNCVRTTIVQYCSI
jgi:hypothetical protein